MKFINLTLSALALMLFSAPLWALSSDKQQPIEVEADRFNLDDAKEVTVYSGNVVITQGSMEIIADEVTIYSVRGTTDKVVGIGKPVKFKQQPDGNQSLIRGEANRFNYFVTKDTLVLIDKAILWQDANTFESDLIEYDSKNSLVKAGDKKTGSKRVKVTLEPAKK